MAVAEEAVPVVADVVDRNNLRESHYIRTRKSCPCFIKIFRNKRGNEEGDLFMCISITFG